MKAKDLFGKALKESELDITEEYIRDRDKLFFSEKVKRLKYLHKINPNGLVIAGQMELVLSYREIQFCFIDGHFMATIVLCQAFTEKLLHNHYNELGFEKVANKGLNAILKHARDNNILNEFLIKKVDNIRLMRNPITHLKDGEYEHGLDKRSFKNRLSPMTQLEKDATSALEIATFFAITDLKRIL